MRARRRHVVIVGAGFGGLKAARNLCRAPVDVTLVDRRNHHLFQPLLYQVATAGLGPEQIAVPIRTLLRKQPHCHVLMANAENVDFTRQRVFLDDGAYLSYDYLILAGGAVPNYFGNTAWRRDAAPLKDLDSALGIRERLLLAFEAAEREPDPDKRRRLLSVVVIGGGPTGVELAGAISELGRLALAREYRNVRAQDITVTLVEMAPRLLPGGFDPDLSAQAKDMLEEIGVEVRTGARVEEVRAQEVRTTRGTLHAANVIWASGVKPAALAAKLGAAQDRQGRVVVEADCSLAQHPNVFVIGDMASFTPADAERALPALAPVAIQQGASVARNIGRDIEGQPRVAFRYRDKGLLATIGRSRGVAQFGSFKAAGLWAWWLWTVVHIYYLIGFRNRLLVMFDWIWRYLTHRPGARVIIGRVSPPADAARPERELESNGPSHPLPPDLFP